MRLGWVDSSTEERNKIVNILNYFSSSGALDELGIGSVRDAFSDMFFPGISVLQTRAKYFVLIPYLFEYAQKNMGKNDRLNSRTVLNYINKLEDKLIKTLMDNSKPSDGENLSIIGMRNGYVVNKPTAIYWNGLRNTGILRYNDLSLEDACRLLLVKCNNNTPRLVAKQKNNDLERDSDDKDVIYDGNHIFEPIQCKYELMKNSSINLEHYEADFLYKQFTTNKTMKNSLIAYMLQHPELCSNFDSFETFDINVLKYNNTDLYNKLFYAKQFSDFIYGAHILYNIILAEGILNSNSNATIFDTTQLYAAFDEYRHSFKSPDIETIVSMTNCPKIKNFLCEFSAAIEDNDINLAKTIIIQREYDVKKKKSKLNKPEEYNSFTTPIHFFKLSYRYGTAIRIMKDILKEKTNV